MLRFSCATRNWWLHFIYLGDFQLPLVIPVLASIACFYLQLQATFSENLQENYQDLHYFTHSLDIKLLEQEILVLNRNLALSSWVISQKNMNCRSYRFLDHQRSFFDSTLLYFLMAVVDWAAFKDIIGVKAIALVADQGNRLLKKHGREVEIRWE